MITPEVLGRALGESPNPELARVAVSRIGERATGRDLLSRPDIIPAAARLLGFSTAASDFFVAHPEELASLADLSPRFADDYVDEAGQDVARLGELAGLRRFRRRAAYRIAARDLSGAPVEDVMAELTAIGGVCLQIAVEATGSAGELSVIGMGKLGGLELNYSSDVDVLFVHGSGGLSSEEASRAAARVIALLSDPTEDGVAVRVDAGLRPEGRSGVLSRSLESMLEYYRKHAATWERQALLKARPVAGNIELGRSFVEGVAPFVYPAVLPASAIEDVRSSKARIEEVVRSRGKEAVELKRGHGGIRDIEFAVQLLQIVHGRRYDRIRNPNTLTALDALAHEGFVAPADARTLADSYRFLRRLEHRLQMVQDTQTHELPSDPARLGPLARSMAFRNADELRTEYGKHTDTVRGLHERLFYRPLLEAFAEPVPRPATDRTATEELLAALGFADTAAAYDSLDRIIDPATRLGKVLETLFPVVVPALAFASLPDAAVVRFERVVEGLREAEGIGDALANHPDAARRLAALVAVSSAFADALIAAPDLTTTLLDSPTSLPTTAGARPRETLVLIAGAYAAHEINVPEVGRHLTDVADAVVGEAIDDVSPPLPLAVIGFGRLGGEELSFGSDLDVMVVYDGEGPSDFHAAAKAAEEIFELIRGSGWRIDADLRPEGKSGPLARSMVSFLEYWGRWAQTWEYQTLLRARFVGGDEPLGRRFVSAAADWAFPEHLTFDRLAEIRRMRVRMEEERVRPADARRFHFKLGYGGLADVQFALELSLMRYGFAHPEIRRTNTLEALQALAESRRIEDSVALTLGEAWVFLSEVKNALEIERLLPAEAIPPAPEAQTALARRLGYTEGARRRFLEDYRRVTRRARLAMERVFYGEERP
ncbi:MAG TPA: bifunctional glutamine-synthetase adenylyltransferase/deadenyltransferase [Actinomycetota bacterium]|nr:bifunctional glutamine-synthetase adenylyltransferase/deadenyltransferase [Actinomycetota bacterium]